MSEYLEAINDCFAAAIFVGVLLFVAGCYPLQCDRYRARKRKREVKELSNADIAQALVIARRRTKEHLAIIEGQFQANRGRG